jgi:hypothetical protein
MTGREHSLLIQKAAGLVGGEERLRMLLGVSWSELHGWLDRGGAVPANVFLKLVDLLERAPSVPADIRSAVHPLLAADYAPGSRAELCALALDAALAAAGTDLGNVQLLDAEGALRIAAQRGFEPPFLDFFDTVKGPDSACGVALILARQYAIADVKDHPVFAGTQAGEVVVGAGVRAVESTPIMSASGVALGMLSVHHRCPGMPGDSVMALLARIARRAGALLETAPAV